jgi:hypothetical protein
MAGVGRLCREALEDHLQHLPGGESGLVEQGIDEGVLIGGQFGEQPEGILVKPLRQAPHEAKVFGLQTALDPPHRLGALHDLTLRELRVAG